MFDEINGLPVHPLAVHAAVVMVPLALLGVRFVVPPLRERSRVPLAIVAPLAAVSAFVAKQSGAKLVRGARLHVGR
ncbi:MAG: hypothetical protein WKF82_06310 [Nocardioidaceae bacterium]